jgi:hypothetical protein
MRAFRLAILPARPLDARAKRAPDRCAVLLAELGVAVLPAGAVEKFDTAARKPAKLRETVFTGLIG